MFKTLFFLLIFVSPVLATTTNLLETTVPSIHNVEEESEAEALELYEEINTTGEISKQGFLEALVGLEKINAKNKEIITLIDFTKPSTQKRLFVLDVKNKKVLLSSLVAHGRNSGENFATSFSNINGSYQSSLGFFVTENEYIGRNGYSLILNGVEKGINDNAKSRAIVIHGAKYANPSVISSGSRLGRSLGCPAVPENLATPLIETIKDGSIVYIFAGDNDYKNKSKILS